MTERLASAPVVLVIIAIASVQLGSSLAKDLYSAAAPLTVAWLRLLGAAVVLGLITRPRLRARSASDWAWVVAYGLCLAGMNVTFYLAIERIPIGMAVTLEFLGPLGVSVALSRRARDLLWVGLAAVGVALLGFSPGDLDPVGVFWALAAACLWAGYILLAGPTGRRWSGVSGVAVAFWVGLAGLTPVVWALDLFPAAVPAVWGLGLMIGLLSSAIPYGLEMMALRRIEPRIFGILMSLEPAAAALFALALLGETLRPIEILAMACVVVASIGVVRSSRPARPSADAVGPEVA
ncbi:MULTISPECIES: DMT family transporter [unclassified Propioniciclava]|uniref:EamA family transporter n=1 Tax=unclassified Propioniciclava TaxID=2642922 RepID=UPI001FB7597F|nr:MULTISPECIES: EamA family transporter [unclassified Propioniciclava]